MPFRGLSAFILVGMVAMTPQLAHAANIMLVMGGEAYDGPPKFEISFDGKKLGDGAVTKAIDTGTDKRFADAADKADYVESFSFDLPDAQFKPDAEIRVKLTNEAFGGEGSNRDRNLYIARVVVNGTPLDASKWHTVSAKGDEPNAMLGDYLVLFDGGKEAVAPAPEGGWPKEEAVAAKAEPAPAAKPEPVTAEAKPEAEAVPKKAVTAEIKPAPEAAKPEVVKPEVVAVKPTEPAAAVTEAVPDKAVASLADEAAKVVPETALVPAEKAVEPEPAKVAEATPEVAPVKEAAAATPDACDETFNIMGFNENSSDLTPKVVDRLDEIAKVLGKNECKAMLTGYSSTQGSYSLNALFSIERAQNSLKYLRDKGVKFSSAQASGVGETKQFGPSFRENRRVVLVVTP
jgi:outer membrane protein OmpA-like peptidoglycan-associated protein